MSTIPYTAVSHDVAFECPSLSGLRGLADVTGCLQSLNLAGKDILIRNSKAKQSTPNLSCLRLCLLWQAALVAGAGGLPGSGLRAFAGPPARSGPGRSYARAGTAPGRLVPASSAGGPGDPPDATGAMVIHATPVVFPSHATCDGHFRVVGHAQKGLQRNDLLWPGAAGAGGRAQAARCGSRPLLAGRAAALRLQRAARGWPGARGVRCGGRPERCLGGSRAAMPALRHSLGFLSS